MLILILICLCIVAFEFYTLRYYKSEKFVSMQTQLKDYIEDVNTLNKYIINLQGVYDKIIQRTNYGSGTLEDKSKFNYKRPQQINSTRSKYVYECSASVCKNASQQPFKYLCKYFNIPITDNSLYVFESILEKFLTAEDGKELLTLKLQDLESEIKRTTPRLIYAVHKKNIIKRLGISIINYNNVYFPTYVFRYVSPGGNKTTQFKICMDIIQLQSFIKYIKDILDNKKTASYQRTLMTPKLRTAIKKRDKYTCQNCGLSTTQEPHLLLEIDHIIPVSKGGLSVPSNLQTLCWKCNRTKGNKIY